MLSQICDRSISIIPGSSSSGVFKQGTSATSNEWKVVIQVLMLSSKNSGKSWEFREWKTLHMSSSDP
jgi:hypothetical protein